MIKFFFSYNRQLNFLTVSILVFFNLFWSKSQVFWGFILLFFNLRIKFTILGVHFNFLRTFLRIFWERSEKNFVTANVQIFHVQNSTKNLRFINEKFLNNLLIFLYNPVIHFDILNRVIFQSLVTEKKV